MAYLRNGVPLLSLLVATAFLATSVSASDPDAAVAAVQPPPQPEQKVSWADFMTLHADRVNLMSAQDSGVTTMAAPPKGRTIVVDQSGKGNFKTIQQAINSIPQGNKNRITIVIKNGVYRYSLTAGALLCSWVG